MTKLVIFCEVFLALLVYSEACLCPSQHPQTKFCNSEFVVQAKVFRRQTFNREGNVVYTVKILKDFKNDTRQYSKTQKIYTSASSCGSDFELNEEYIISGTINGQKWKTSKCSWNTKTSFLTKYQNTALNHGIYKNSCSCKIIECSFSGIPCSQETKGACVIRSVSDVKCWYQKNSCSLTTIGCGWSSPVCPRP